MVVQYKVGIPSPLTIERKELIHETRRQPGQRLALARWSVYNVGCPAEPSHLFQLVVVTSLLVVTRILRCLEETPQRQVLVSYFGHHYKTWRCC
jgi:hypothetical protein